MPSKMRRPPSRRGERRSHAPGVKAEWRRMLQFMVDDFRRQYPRDGRTDHELCESLMDHFAEGGLVEKDVDGKYLIPRLVNLGRFVAPWDVERN
jgi:hypothetical protein